MRFMANLGGFALASAMVSSPAFAEVPRNPTFTKDVAPIFFNNCTNCHRPGDIAPMSLLSYEESRPWAKSIAQSVESGKMPPWHADAGVGKFSNDRSLTDDEKETILRWVKRGAKQGKKADMPSVPENADSDWRLGTPDLIVEFDKTEVKAGDSDLFFDLTAKTGLTEDTWVHAVEVLPSNRKVTHHVIIWQGSQSESRGWVGAWAAGMEPMEFPEGTGRLMKAGSSLTADMHYHPAETDEVDQTRIGLYFAKDNKVEKELVNLWVQNAGFEIPAGDPDYRARASYTFPQDSYITALLPHMHYRGKSFTYTAKFPDGRKEKLLSVSDYDFNWQTGYELEERLYVPKGTRIDCVAEWDNSAANESNPDPTRTVTFGDESYDEMMIGFVDYVVKDGVSPPSAQDVLAELAVELNAQYPGEVYLADVIDPEDGGIEAAGIVYLPRDKSTGLWKISLAGSMFDATVADVMWVGDHFTASASVMSQTFEISGDVDPNTGELNGYLKDVGNDENQGPIVGRRVTP